MPTTRLDRSVWAILALLLIHGLSGLNWGLPSPERHELVLNPRLRNIEFYEQVSRARDDMYEKMGGQSIAYLGQLSRQDMPNQLPTLLNSYSSFMVKTHNMDEAVVLVMLSHLNPLQNQWYPHSFVYGGAYIYSLAGFMGAAHLFKIIHLVPSVAYYFEHPDKMADIYLATRFWTLLGFWLAVMVSYFLTRDLTDSRMAVWTALFFGLAPVSAFAKVTKPHTWAAFLTLVGIFCVFKARQDLSRRGRHLVAGAIAFGLSIGTTVTQGVFLPFLLFGCWEPDWRKAGRRILLMSGLVLACYLLANFYLFNHWKAFVDEQYVISRYSSFRLRPGAPVDFLRVPLLASMSGFLLALGLGGTFWLAFRRGPRELIRLVSVLGVTFLAVSFKLQNFVEPYVIRWFIAMVPLLCIPAVWLTFQWGTAGRVMRWICLAILLVKAGLYDLHLMSDQAPYDNASLAARWIHDHLPDQTWIGQSQGVPDPQFFPPVDLSRYRFCSFRNPECLSDAGPRYAVLSGQEYGLRLKLEENGFLLVRRFAESPLQKLGQEDPFLNANFPVDIYEKKS